MEGVQSINYADLVLRRTIYVTNLRSEWTTEYLTDIFSNFGEVDKVKLDVSLKDRAPMAFIQFASEDSAREALARSSISVVDKVMRISPSRITIDVIPPIDAVFGKAMTVGKHVMAVNHSKPSSRAVDKQESAMRAVNQAAIKVLQAVSERVGIAIDREEFIRLKEASQTQDRHHQRDSRTFGSRGSPQ